MSTPAPSNPHSNAQIIRDSFALLAPHAGKLMDRFYERLFARAPQVRSMFPADMTKQKAHLAAAVGLVVKHADNLAALEKPLLDMGATSTTAPSPSTIRSSAMRCWVRSRTSPGRSGRPRSTPRGPTPSTPSPPS